MADEDLRALERRARDGGPFEVAGYTAALLRAGQGDGALRFALEAWRRARDPALADLVDQLSAAVPDDPLAARLASLGQGTQAEVRERLRALEDAPHDPRIARALGAIVEAVPFRSTSSQPIWRLVFARLVRERDPRMVPLLEATLARPSAISGATMREWFALQLQKTLGALRAAAPAGPAAADLRGALGTVAAASPADADLALLARHLVKSGSRFEDGRPVAVKTRRLSARAVSELTGLAAWSTVHTLMIESATPEALVPLLLHPALQGLRTLICPHEEVLPAITALPLEGLECWTVDPGPLQATFAAFPCLRRLAVPAPDVGGLDEYLRSPAFGRLERLQLGALGWDLEAWLTALDPTPLPELVVAATMNSVATWLAPHAPTLAFTRGSDGRLSRALVTVRDHHNRADSALRSLREDRLEQLELAGRTDHLAGEVARFRRARVAGRVCGPRSGYPSQGCAS